MATVSKQQSAINAAQNLAGLMGQFVALRQGAKAFVDAYNSEAYNTTWTNMATAALNADGSIGTADGTPNTAHPITVGNIYKSETQLVAAVVCLQQFINFCSNQAVTTGNYNQSMDDLAS